MTAPTTFIQHYESAAPAIYAWAAVRVRRGLQHLLDPEDLVQEICCRAYDRFSTFEPQKGPFRAWIFGIANNVLRESLAILAGPEGKRRLHATWSSLSPAAVLPDEATSVSRRVARDEAMKLFIERLLMLEEDEKKLFVLRGLEGLSHEDASLVLGVGVEAVQKRWQRLLVKIDAWRPPPGALASCE